MFSWFNSCWLSLFPGSCSCRFNRSNRLSTRYLSWRNFSTHPKSGSLQRVQHRSYTTIYVGRRPWKDLYRNLKVRFNNNKNGYPEKRAKNFPNTMYVWQTWEPDCGTQRMEKHTPPARPPPILCVTIKMSNITSTSSLRFRRTCSNWRASACRSNLLRQRVSCLCFLLWKI